MANPKITSSFKKTYESLNEKQKLAVDTLEGPVLVIAGPGTGKTQIITTRIANLLYKTDTPPSAILALTFTDSAAQNMKTRLLSLIGPSAYGVNIATFHSFGASIITQYPEYFIFSQTQQQLTDIERLEIVQTIITKSNLETLKPINAPHYYVQSIISAIQTLKREAILPNDLNISLKDELEFLDINQDNLTKTEFNSRQKNLQKNLELFQIYSTYQETLQKKGRFDFEDMINWVINALENEPDLLSVLQERYQYFLVDEYQDTNSAQNKLLDLLASFWSNQANIFVVGDDEQSIFRFQGASLENVLNFQKTYPNTKVITLTENYRSHQLLLDASRSLISNNKLSLQNQLPQIQRQLTASNPTPSSKINLIKTQHQLTEQLFLARSLQDLLSQGISPEQIAIIGRNHTELKSLSQVLKSYDIPYKLLSGENILDSLVVKYFLKLLDVIFLSRTSLDDLSLFTVLHYPFLSFKSLDILKLSRAASEQKSTLIDHINRNQDSTFTPFVEQLAEFNKQESTLTFLEFIQDTLEKSGLLTWVLSDTNSAEHIKNLNIFFDFIKSQNAANKELNLEQFLQTIALMRQNNLDLKNTDLEPLSNRVTLTTAHKAKGLEWDYVYIINCYDGKWGNQTTRDLIKLPASLLHNSTLADHDPIEDERRLFYVALTRTKKQTIITYAENYNSYGRNKAVIPSIFVSEIPSKSLEISAPNYSDGEINQFIQETIALPSPSNTEDQADYLRSIISNFKLSVTALNTYLECAYKFKLNNLFKVPKAKQSYLSFGTAVHAALERFHNKLKSEAQTPSKDYFLNEFESALRREILTQEDFNDRLKQGKKVLSAYYDLHRDNFSPSFFTEKFFGYSSSAIFFDDIQLVGKVDRIDLINPTTKEVRVVDYKTGKRKTRGQIEGTTQDSDGAYKRQLVFYKLLADLDQSFPNNIAEVELDFIETPHQENKPGKESFQITSEEVSELKQVIKESMQKIRQIEFPRTKDKSICQRCEFVDHCWPQGLPQ